LPGGLDPGNNQPERQYKHSGNKNTANYRKDQSDIQGATPFRTLYIRVGDILSIILICRACKNMRQNA